MTRRGASLTIYDIAKSASVSPKTVSRVINRNPQVGAELRDRVNKAIEELGYEPNLSARALKGPRGYTLAMLTHPELVEPPEDDDWFLVPYIGALEAAALRTAQQYGYRFLVEGVHLDAEAMARDLSRYQRRQIDGVVLVPPVCDDAGLLDALAARAIPSVRISPGIAPERGATISIDERGGARAATEHLLGLGHRRIAMISGPSDHGAATARVDGFRDAMAGVGDAWEPPIVQGDFLPASGYRITGDLLDRAEPPTAIFAANDGMAAGVIAAGIDRGLRLPRDLSVVGFDDTDAARYTWPPLTTVRQPLTLMAREAIELLSAMVDGLSDAPARVQLDHRLVVRKSTCPPL
ncbi:MAG: LacI family DNA-binding transcriptional regulator [Sphingomonas sp.]